MPKRPGEIVPVLCERRNASRRNETPGAIKTQHRSPYRIVVDPLGAMNRARRARRYQVGGHAARPLLDRPIAE